MKKVPWLHIALFAATFLTTLAAGALQQGIDIFKAPGGIIEGLSFAGTLMTILLCHELSHYIASKKHHTHATLPYFIPAPSLIGTFGAFIKMKSPIVTRKALIDIGASGPISGFVEGHSYTACHYRLAEPWRFSFVLFSHESSVGKHPGQIRYPSPPRCLCRMDRSFCHFIEPYSYRPARRRPYRICYFRREAQVYIDGSRCSACTTRRIGGGRRFGVGGLACLGGADACPRDKTPSGDVLGSAARSEEKPGEFYFADYFYNNLYPFSFQIFIVKYIAVTSPSNPVIKEALKLKRKSGRHEAFLVEGPRLIETALNADAVFRKVFFTPELSAGEEGRALLERLAKKTPQLIETSEQALAKLADTETPQGIIAVVAYSPFELGRITVKAAPLLVVCDGIQDPGNLGTIIRGADAAGADAVVLLPGTCDAFMPKVVRATAGSLFNIPVLYSETGAFLAYTRSKGIALCIADARAPLPVYEYDFRKPTAIILGNEAHGVSRLVHNNATIVVKIPMIGRAESLNAAMAATVLLYEAMRQRFYS
jgi:TrmH family RNA methyltransferase